MSIVLHKMLTIFFAKMEKYIINCKMKKITELKIGKGKL